MAVHQITITENGTKTLKTSGKYCDRDIEVSVSVGSGSGSAGITPTGTKTITANGTHDVTNYATAEVDVEVGVFPSGTKEITEDGTYDVTSYAAVNVDVPVQPTQFTNILSLATTIVKEGYRVVSSGYTATPSGVAVVFPIAAGTHRIRVRGKYIFGLTQLYSNGSIAAFNTNVYQSNATPTSAAFSGSVIANYKNDNSGLILSTDESNDFYIDVTVSADSYLGLTLKNMAAEFPTGKFSDPIMTIDEPIGNGGYIG